MIFVRQEYGKIVPTSRIGLLALSYPWAPGS